jgi:hypothetical protein
VAHLYGHKVSEVCGRHANTISVNHPSVHTEPIS